MSRHDTQPSVFDTLLQGCTVALFHDYGVATAPLTRVTVPVDEFRPHYPVGLIAFGVTAMDGTLSLSWPLEVHAQLQQNQGRRLDARDLVREFVNQVMGRIKNRLIRYQLTLRSGLPTCIDREAALVRLGPRSGRLTVYAFRTIHGQILVSISAIDEAQLVYSSEIKLNTEGDIIVF